MMWFNNKRDEGVIYQDYFNPIAIPAIALILTAVSFFCPVKECFNGFFSYVIYRLNAISTSGRQGLRPISHFMLKNTIQSMTATSSRLMNLGSIRSRETLTFSVVYNVNFITSAGKFSIPSFLKKI